jgi:hypothetical protein
MMMMMILTRVSPAIDCASHSSQSSSSSPTSPCRIKHWLARATSCRIDRQRRRSIKGYEIRLLLNACGPFVHAPQGPARCGNPRAIFACARDAFRKPVTMDAIRKLKMRRGNRAPIIYRHRVDKCRNVHLLV